MLFFNDYRFEVTPAYIHAMANAEAVHFLINGEPAEEVAPYTENGYGPLMPGSYEVRAVFDNSYITLEDTAQVELYDSPIEEVVHSFDFPVDEITVLSNYDEYQLYMNDEQTDIIIHEGEQSIGEFPNDESTTLLIGKEFPWGEVRSEEAIITDENEVEFHIEHALSEETKQELMEKMNQTVADYQAALTEKDASLLDVGVTDAMGKSLEEQIEEIEGDNPDYEGTLVKSVYDADNLSNPVFDEDVDAYKITMRVHHTFPEPNGNLGWMFREESDDEYTRSRELTIVFNEENGNCMKMKTAIL